MPPLPETNSIADNTAERMACKAEESLAPGAVVGGEYRLLHLLAQGGMGAVWAATNMALEMDVAIKFLTGGDDEPTLTQRLKNEARVLAQIQHSSLVSVHDIGITEAGFHYLVMDRLKGSDLCQHLAEHGRLAPTEALRMMLPILDALRAAHGEAIIHRDIKPENLFLAEAQGRVVPKLLDFGVALVQRDRSQRLTRAGAVVGSPLYMSPEQARGWQDLDPRVDVWGVSAVLYECLAGRPPFVGQSYEALLNAIVTEEPPPIGLEGPNAALENIVLKGLQKERDARWSSSQALGQALAGWLLQLLPFGHSADERSSWQALAGARGGPQAKSPLRLAARRFQPPLDCNDCRSATGNGSLQQ